MPGSDDQNPLEAMLPSTDSEEYRRKKAEHEDSLAQTTGEAALAQHAHLADRVQRVRKGAPQNNPPAPPPRAQEAPAPPPNVGTGIEVDPNVGRPPQAEEAPAPQPTPAPAAPAPAPEPAVDPARSPILKKLRQDFGIEAVPLEKVEVGGHTFTMRLLDSNAVTTAVRFSDGLSVSERENALNLQIALTAFAVVAIDSTPLWEVFDISLDQDERVLVEGKWRAVFDPHKPPPRVRMMASTAFMDFLHKEAKMDLTSELWREYQAKVDPKGSIVKLLRGEEEETAEELPLP